MLNILQLLIFPTLGCLVICVIECIKFFFQRLVKFFFCVVTNVLFRNYVLIVSYIMAQIRIKHNLCIWFFIWYCFRKQVLLIFLSSYLSDLQQMLRVFVPSFSYPKQWWFVKYNLTTLSKSLVLVFSLLVIVHCVYYIGLFDKMFYGYQFITIFYWFNTTIKFGVDGISICFIFLTTLLIPLCILIGWEYIVNNIFLYLLSFLLLEIFLLLFFSALNILVLYISFESTLIPMFIIIGLWGGLRKIKASYYFFLFTLAGSVFMLLGILILWVYTGTLSLVFLLCCKFSAVLECGLWLLFFIGFAVKIPIFPFHLWLPEAHVEAPTAGSVLLAGLLLKLGGYGFIRICVCLFPLANFIFSVSFCVLCTLSVLYGSFVAVSQVDLKKLVAYSSIAHMNFGLLGLFTGTQEGVDGCIMSMLSHGFVSSALFISVDIIYRRFGTRLITYYSGLSLIMPKYAFFLAFFCFSNIGFPGTSSFVGEILVFASLILLNSVVTLLAGTTVIWSSLYSLFLLVKPLFGTYKPLSTFAVVFTDLNQLELSICVFLLLFSVVIGLYPICILDILTNSTVFIVKYKTALW